MLTYPLIGPKGVQITIDIEVLCRVELMKVDVHIFKIRLLTLLP